MKIPGVALAALCLLSATGNALDLQGRLTQGGLIRGTTEPGAQVFLDGRALRVTKDGNFVFGFGRDAPPKATLRVRRGDGTETEKQLSIAPRKYRIQRIDGLPPRMVTPPPEVLARIRLENAAIAQARSRDSIDAYFMGNWIRPADGIVTGVYGSQRILNGKKRRPHYGIDFAGPVGAPVVAPASGVVALAKTGLYYTGGTIIIDHGHGLSSAFLHLSEVAVSVGEFVERGQRIGAIGATGRATGPHLDWRINWFERRIDPGFLIGEKSEK